MIWIFLHTSYYRTIGIYFGKIILKLMVYICYVLTHRLHVVTITLTLCIGLRHTSLSFVIF